MYYKIVENMYTTFQKEYHYHDIPKVEKYFLS